MSSTSALRICVCLLAFFCALGLARVLAIVGLHVPLDPNEGWNAYHALHAMSGHGLYPAGNTLLFNNYPPLSFYIVGVAGLVVGDNIVAGRILSLLATLFVMFAIYTAARRMKADVWSASFAALLFLAGLLIFTDYVGMDDPQLLGHAVAMSGLVVLLIESRTSRTAIAAALLMVLAGFIKHNLVALPIAAAIWLALYDRRNALWFAVSNALWFAVSVAVFALTGLIAFRLAYGIDLLGQLNSARLYSFDGLFAALRDWLIWADVPLIGLAALLLLRRDDRYVVLCALYAFVAILTGMLFAGGAGVDLNIWFDAMIALALGAALTLDRLTDRGWLRPVAAIAYMLPLAAGIALNWDDAWLERTYWLQPLSGETAQAQIDIAFLKSHDGPALCEMLSLCYWAGKREEVDVFNLGQAYATGARSDDALVHLIAGHHYRAIEFDSLSSFALTPRVKQALLRAYRVDHENDEGVFLVPR